jgi:hypothetical protein
MKKHVLATLILAITTSLNYAQTNRINHYSHSGKVSTMNIFKANDNMGLGCGSSIATEYIPDSNRINKMIDSSSIDSLKPKVCVPIPIPTSEKPRKGMSLPSKYDVDSVLQKFK